MVERSRFPDDPVLAAVEAESTPNVRRRWVRVVEAAQAAGRTRAQIADALGTTPTNVTGRLRKTRAWLRGEGDV